MWDICVLQSCMCWRVCRVSMWRRVANSCFVCKKGVENVSQGRGLLVLLSPGLLPEAAGDGSRVHGCV